jgi:uncharacterized protein YjeT (DUF2065 family)
MKVVLYLISLLWIAAGCYYILYTNATRDWIKQMLAKVPTKLFALFPVVVGLLLILAAPASSKVWFIRLLGALGVAKGAIAFFNPNGWWDKALDWYLTNLSDQTMRLYGIIALILGTVIFSWI